VADPTVKPVETRSFLDMSDEEMMNAAPPSGEVVVNTPAEDGDVDEVVEATETKPAEAKEADDADDDKDDEGTDTPDTKDDVEDGDDKDAGTAAEKDPDDAAKEDPTKAKAPAEVKEAKDDKPKEAPAVDYEAEYKKLLAPFKANGREIKVDTVDDAVALMQMGANYSKKMAALKPNLKLMKMLENNGFLSEDKIGFLIDLGKKDPAAISKLVKDSGVDPMDLDAEKASTYKQTAYAVDDREIELDTVLDELQGSPAYTRTLDVVSNKWDVASKQAVSQAPQLLKVLNDHVASGIYDLISTEMEKERLFGRLKGLSDIEAYRQVGDAIQAKGGFNHLVQPSVDTKPAVREVVQPKPKAAVDDTLKDKRRAASSTKAAAPTTTPADFNPLSLSDDDFNKLTPPKFA
jgi:hypothetical protein